MKVDSFWPPQHSWDRLLAEAYRRRNRDQPWVTRGAVKLLGDLVNSSDRVIEWGSGSSTRWFGLHAASVRSIEHDPTWYERVMGQLTGIAPGHTEVSLLSADPAANPDASPYVRVIDEFGDGSLEVAFVDGEHRAACCLAALPKLAPGGLLILDDAHNYLDHPSPSPHSRHARGHLDGDWSKFASAIRDWRLIWSSDGYSDTAFWFKP